MERMTRLELATSTLARWRSTRWAKSALKNMRSHILWCLRSESNQRHGDFQSPALPTELQRRKRKWRPGWGSNPRPLAWQASVLTNWTTGPGWWELQGSNLWPSACKADALPAELSSRSSLFSHVISWRLNYFITKKSICQAFFEKNFRFFSNAGIQRIFVCISALLKWFRFWKPISNV